MGNVNNQSPVGISTFSLPDGKQNVTYVINNSDLLLGFSDADNDTLTVISIFADNGDLVANGSDKWNFVPSNNYSGVVNLDYLITDNFDGEINVTKSFTIINDTPVIVKTNSPPTGDVSIKGILKQGEILTASNTLSDKDNLGTLSYQWLRNGEPISNGSQSSYALTEADVGKLIKVKVSYVDGANTTETVISPETSLIFPKDEIKIPTYSLSASQATANEGDVVTLKLMTTNVVDGTKVPFSFTGNISNEDVIGGIPSSFYVGSDGIGTLALGFKSDNLTEGNENLTFTLTDDAKQFVMLSILDTSLSPVVIPVIKNNPPIGGVVIKGSPFVGQTLTVTNSLTDYDGLGTIFYKWLSNGQEIIGATQSNYTLKSSDVGKSVSVVASYTDNLKNFETVSSNTINQINNAVPTYNLTATKSQVNEGDSVTLNLVTTNLSNGSVVDVNFGGEIRNDDVNNSFLSSSFIIDANGKSSMTLDFLDDKTTEGDEYLTVTLVDDSKQTVNVSVNDTSTNQNNPLTGSVTIKGNLKVGSILSATNSIKDADGIGDLNFEWQTDRGLLSSDETLTLTKNELGKKIWLTISYVDDLGNFEVVKSNVTAPIENILVKPSKGNDLLIGSDNNDKISALTGNDTLIGGLGKDTLIGGLGADVFKFNDIKETGIDAKSRDTVSDFTHKAGDKIDLSSIDANLSLAGNQAFTFIGNKAFSANATGQLRFDSTAKVLYGSVNADKNPEFSILLSGVKILVIDGFIL